ncbi:hypothetical protein [Brasilonema sp. UFV-L1]|uniref:hypothetical protein n=1 Tax=Brasilonema sp. UFV-L1 TaxID=2234130 RepID=UPI00145C3AF3|nr:hypothetical protein [Brasilonema sp. UFV-L1]
MRTPHACCRETLKAAVARLGVSRQVLQRDGRCYKSAKPPNALPREPPQRTGSPSGASGVGNPPAGLVHRQI